MSHSTGVRRGVLWAVFLLSISWAEFGYAQKFKEPEGHITVPPFYTCDHHALFWLMNPYDTSIINCSLMV
jgi:hypothetical protein